jgi:hypothetical protein
MEPIISLNRQPKTRRNIAVLKSCRGRSAGVRRKQHQTAEEAMAITLYDAMPSGNSDRVKVVLHEKGLAYDRVTLDLAKKEQKRPEFLRLNPYGKVPVIDDDGKVLFESCIINEYLEEQYLSHRLCQKILTHGPAAASWWITR